MTEYIWHSPGGLYVVPDEWRRRFLSEFPDYRVRWSLKKSCWQIEQAFGNPLPAIQTDEVSDDRVRMRDGYWLVMETQPGDRMACPTVIDRFPRQTCGWTVSVPHRQTREVACDVCRSKRRDGRTIASYWPFDELLLDHLRSTNPLTWGIVKKDGKVQTRAAYEADRANKLRERELDRQQSDNMTSLDYTDYRWLNNIPSSSALRRKVDDTTFR